jgi:putative membrane protein
MVTKLFSEADRAHIEAAVQKLEKRSSIELVVAVLHRSADYWQWRVLLAGCWALAAAFAALYFDASLHPVWAVALEPPIGAAAFAVLGWGPVYRGLIPSSLAAQTVRGRAFQAFAEHGLHRTRDRTGLLILISELERQVVILGDSGLHQHVGESGWQEHVALLVRRIRERKAASGVVEVIEQMAETLAVEFPPRADDINELSDAVIEG